MSENKCLAATHAIADFERMPEFSGVPADTPDRRYFVLLVPNECWGLANGVPPRDVAKNLGGSVPTLYRWIPASSRS